MTKEDKIKEAYGDNYIHCKFYIDKEGWIWITNLVECRKKQFDFLNLDSKTELVAKNGKRYFSKEQVQVFLDEN